MKRVFAIDFTRGLVMVIMVLDHVRDMMHVNSITQSPVNLSTTTPILFFTRWITYLCAPIFVFLAGTSAFISWRNKGNTKQSQRFLIKRGIWLILLEFTVVNFGMFFDIGFHTLIFEVIATIGFGFIILGLLLPCHIKTIAIIGLIILFGHDMFSFLTVSGKSVDTLLNIFFGLKAFPINQHFTFVMAYPPIPWLGIMLIGFATGRLFELPAAKKNFLFVIIGIAALMLFTGLRLLNIYGDPIPWSFQKSGMFTFLSFMNVSKYPPSLVFCLVTLGIMFLIFVFSEQIHGRLMKFVSVYGKVPFFYFLTHFYLIHIALIGLLLLQGFHWNSLEFASGTFGRPRGVQSGISLGVVYIIWIAVVLILYQPCLWYSRYKSRYKYQKWWLRYI